MEITTSVAFGFIATVWLGAVAGIALTHGFRKEASFLTVMVAVAVVTAALITGWGFALICLAAGLAAGLLTGHRFIFGW